MSYHQLHCLLQDLGLCLQCLATHYLEFQTSQPLTLYLLQLKFPISFLHYAGFFSYYAGIMLYAFYPLLCLKLCWHNRRKPISHPKLSTHCAVNGIKETSLLTCISSLILMVYLWPFPYLVYFCDISSLHLNMCLMS